MQLLSGVAADDLVVVGNHAQLKEGARITPKLLLPAASRAQGGY